MASIFPTSGNGLEVRDPVTGAPIVVPNVGGVYVPAAPFKITCNYNALPNDCRSRVENQSVNAFVSEMLALAEVFDPDGTWDCAEYDNLATMFRNWVADFSSQDIGGQICEVANGDGTEAAARLIYCANAVAKGLPIVGPDSLSELLQSDICTNAAVGAPNTVDDYLLYCRGGLFRKTSPRDIMLYMGEWAQPKAYSTANMVQKESRLWSPNAAIAGGTAFVVGTAGATWREVSPTAAPPWLLDNGYPKDTIISKDGKYYAANADIPAGTAFTIGATGATWREVDLTKTSILEFDPATIYRVNNVVTLNRLIYRALPLTFGPGAWNPAQWEMIGGEPNLYRGIWSQPSGYSTEHMVQKDGKLYSPNAVIPPGTAFALGTSGATWFEVSPSVAPAWDETQGYLQDTVIFYNGFYWAANADIPPDTPFAEGTSGETWRKVSMAGGEPVVPDFADAVANAERTLVVRAGILYRAKAPGHAAGTPWNAAEWENLSGGAGTWKGAYAASTAYAVGDVVFAPVAGYSGTPFWKCVVTIANSPALFDVDDWQQLSDIGYLLNYDPLRGYVTGARVVVAGNTYSANDAIPSGTPFAIGYTGATWKPEDALTIKAATTGTTYTLGAGDENALLNLSNAGAKTVTVPAGSTWNPPTGTVVFLRVTGGRLTLAAAVGVTIASVDNLLTLVDKPNAGAALVKTAADTWWLTGNVG